MCDRQEQRVNMPGKYASIDNKLIAVKDDTVVENHRRFIMPYQDPESNDTGSALCLELPHSLNLVQ
jgi:hypothetical protein